MAESNNNNEHINQFNIGERIQSDDGYIGTIRYEGKVDGFDGHWFGIEWDDPKRGKHFGTVKGKQYFTCQYNGSGSFMKAEKLTKGRKFMDMLFSKYHQKIENYDDLYVETIKPDVKVPIEMIGMNETRERLKNFKQQITISASHLLISEIDDHPIIYDYFKNLQNLDLSNSLLYNWNQIIQLIIQLPNLNKLVLSNNRLSFNESEFVNKCIEIKNNINTINNNDNNSNINNNHNNNNNNNNNNIKIPSNNKSLVLNNLYISDFNILLPICKQIFINLQSLVLSNNLITNISCNNNNNNCFINTFSNLITLDLAHNKIKSFDDILIIGSLDNLQELNLNNNQIESIQFNDIDHNSGSTASTKLFKNLKILYLSNNNISDWKYVEELDYLQSLVELSFRENPIIDSLVNSSVNSNINNEDSTTKIVTTSTGVKKISVNKNIYLNRLNIIPRISKLSTLNLSHITPIERKDAELYFLYENYGSLIKNDSTLNINSRKLKYLVSIHGEPLYTKEDTTSIVATNNNNNNNNSNDNSNNNNSNDNSNNNNNDNST